MRNARVREIVAAGALVVSGASAHAQDAGDRLRVAASGEVRYALHATIRVGEAAARTYDAALTLVWSGMDADGGEATLRCEGLTVDKASGAALVVKAAEEGVTVEPGEGGGWSEEEKQSAAALMRTEFRLVIDADGQVEAIRGAERFALASAALGASADETLGPLAAAQIGRTVEPIFSANGAPAQTPAKWETSRDWALGPARTLTLAGQWRSEVDGAERVRVSGEYAISTATADDASPAAPDLRVEEFCGAVESAWDTVRGLLLERSERLTFAAVWSIEDIERRTSVSSEITLRLLDDQDAPAE